MIKNVEAIIGAFTDYPNHAKIAEALRLFAKHPDLAATGHIIGLAERLAVPTLIRVISANRHIDLPTDILVDELVDFATVFAAQNSTIENGKSILHLRNIDTADMPLMMSDPAAFSLNAFMHQFNDYLVTLLGETPG